MYADDLVLIADSEENVQSMLHMNFSTGAFDNSMCINATKSNIIHFRPNCIPRTTFNFTCGNLAIGLADMYMYLGLALTEHFIL